MSKNDVTGDSIATRFGSAEQKKAFDETAEPKRSGFIIRST